MAKTNEGATASKKTLGKVNTTPIVMEVIRVGINNADRENLSQQLTRAGKPRLNPPVRITLKELISSKFPDYAGNDGKGSTTTLTDSIAVWGLAQDNGVSLDSMNAMLNASIRKGDKVTVTFDLENIINGKDGIHQNDRFAIGEIITVPTNVKVNPGAKLSDDLYNRIMSRAFSVPAPSVAKEVLDDTDFGTI